MNSASLTAENYRKIKFYVISLPEKHCWEKETKSLEHFVGLVPLY